MAFALLLACPNVIAGFLTGEELADGYRAWKRYTDNGDGTAIEAAKAAKYAGYVQGAMDVAQLHTAVCADGASLSQSARVIGKYLEDRPEKWRGSAGPLVLEALSRAFPCPVGR